MVNTYVRFNNLRKSMAAVRLGIRVNEHDETRKYDGMQNEGCESA